MEWLLRGRWASGSLPAGAAASADALAEGVLHAQLGTGWPVLLLVAAVAGAAAVAWWRAKRERRRNRRVDDNGDPLVQLFVPPGLASRSNGATPRRLEPLAADLPAANGGGSPPSHSLFNSLAQPGSAAAASPRPVAPRGVPAGGPLPSPASAPRMAAPAVAEEVRVGPILFHPPPDGTLQMLPGRLEIAGRAAGEEIRFVRIPGRQPVVTFGRSQGEPHSHIRLDARTVSRMHAALHFTGGRWHVENLSATNPVLVNGTALPAAGGELVPLADGDTLEMGEVTFRFRDR